MTAQTLRSILPAASLALLLAAIFWLQPRTMSYFGLNLLLNLAVATQHAYVAELVPHVHPDGQTSRRLWQRR